MTEPTLYKRTSAGKVQIWFMEIDGGKFRTTSGQKDGKLVTSEWTIAEPKNVGRSNETTAEEQAKLEVAAIYKKKLEQNGYFQTEEEIDGDRGLFEPMLAKPFDPERLPDDEAVFVQPKFNGARCIVRMVAPYTYPTLWSRKGKQFVNCPHIGEELVEFFKNNPDAILDGELYNHTYHQDFEKLISSIKKQKPTEATIKLAKRVVRYYVYDIPSHPGTFGERLEALHDAFANDIPENEIIWLSPTWRTTDVKTIQGLHEKNLADGYEGTIVRLDREYENKRTFSLMKYKDFKDAEFEILNILPGKGNWSKAAKIVVLALPKGVLSAKGEPFFSAGFKGSMAEGKRLLAERYEHIGKPGTVVYFDETAAGVPLFGIFHGVRDYE